MKWNAYIFILLAWFSLFLFSSNVQAESKAAAPAPAASASAPAAPSLMSANGFSCSHSANQVSCQGKFNDLDKDITFMSSGAGSLVIQAQKDEEIYSYSSLNGCLCKQSKKEIQCNNAKGKGEKFKGDKMKEESSAFCQKN